MKKIMKIAKKYNLLVIEDACQAHGSEIYGKKTGSFGLAGCFSFYPTKNMTTGEGGIVTTNSKKIAKKIMLLRGHGMKVRYYHDIIGYNFRMTNIAAAIGIEQLKKLTNFNTIRIKNAEILNKYLSKIEGIITPSVQENYSHVFHQYTIKVTKKFKMTRDELSKYLNTHGIATGIYYPVPIHKQKSYKQFRNKEKLSVTDRLIEEVLSLPIHPGLKKADLEKINEIIKSI